MSLINIICRCGHPPKWLAARHFASCKSKSQRPITKHKDDQIFVSF